MYQVSKQHNTKISHMDRAQNAYVLILLEVLTLAVTLPMIHAFTPDSQVNWQRCASVPYANSKANSISCATIKVPLLWNNSSDTRGINFFVKRIQCANLENRKVRNDAF